MNNLFQYRLALILGQLLVLSINGIWPIWQSRIPLLWLVCILYLVVVVGIQLLYSKDRQNGHQNSYLMLLDLLIWGLYFYALGGVSNPLIWCLLIPSVLSALSQTVGFTWFLTTMANVLYGMLWMLSPAINVHLSHGESMQQHVTGMWLGFIAVSVLLTWATTTLMQRLNQKNTALLVIEKQRQADENILKMATLATSLAHELGTPLASIKLVIDELKLSLDSPQQTEDLALLDSQVMRCKKVLTELTALTDKNRPDDAKIQLALDFINEIIAEVTSSKSVLIELESNSDGGFIVVDTLLHLALMNLLNNSVAAQAKKINISLNLRKQKLRLSIKDDGVGLAHNKSNGLGIGLALSKRIIKSMGGTLAFSSDHKGAECILDLPLVAGEIDE